MTRGVTTMPVGAAFVGTLAWLRSLLHPHILEDAKHPALAAGVGTAAGAVRSAVGQASLHPLGHAQRSVAAGLLAAGVFAAGVLAEQEQRRLEAELRARLEQQQQQRGPGG
eukprot:scaffold1.g5688.t1